MHTQERLQEESRHFCLWIDWSDYFFPERKEESKCWKKIRDRKVRKRERHTHTHFCEDCFPSKHPRFVLFNLLLTFSLTRLVLDSQTWNDSLMLHRSTSRVTSWKVTLTDCLFPIKIITGCPPFALADSREAATATSQTFGLYDEKKRKLVVYSWPDYQIFSLGFRHFQENLLLWSVSLVVIAIGLFIFPNLTRKYEHHGNFQEEICGS